MEAIELLIADSLADSLSKHTFPGAISTIDAVRRIVPDDAMEEITSLRVSVVPGELDVQNHTRAADLFLPTVHVVIANRFDTNDDLDDLFDLRTNIVDAIRSNALPASDPPMPPGTVYFEISNQITFGRNEIANQRTYLADISIVYRRAQEKVT